MTAGEGLRALALAGGIEVGEVVAKVLARRGGQQMEILELSVTEERDIIEATSYGDASPVYVPSRHYWQAYIKAKVDDPQQLFAEHLHQPLEIDHELPDGTRLQCDISIASASIEYSIASIPILRMSGIIRGVPRLTAKQPVLATREERGIAF